MTVRAPSALPRSPRRDGSARRAPTPGDLAPRERHAQPETARGDAAFPAPAGEPAATLAQRANAAATPPPSRVTTTVTTPQQRESRASMSRDGYSDPAGHRFTPSGPERSPLSHPPR